MVDRAYVDKHTNGYDELVKFLEDYTPERVAELTGINEETLFKVALLYAGRGELHWLDDGCEPFDQRRRNCRRH